MSAIGEIVVEAVGGFFTDIYGEAVGATRDRFGLAAAIVVALAPWVTLGLAIWGLVAWASG